MKSDAYPFTCVGFVAVVLLSALFFGETLNIWKIGGVALVIVGITVARQGA